MTADKPTERNVDAIAPTAPDDPRSSRAVAPQIPDNPPEIAEDIKRTREQLGETVEALLAKTDMKALAKAKATQVASRLRAGAGQASDRAAAVASQRRAALAAGLCAVAVVGCLAAIWWRRR